MSKKTIRNLIAVILVLLLTSGGVIFFFMEISDKNSLLEEQIAALAEQSEQEESLLRLQRISQISQSDRGELASYFLLRESDSIAFLSEIEKLAPSVGVSLETRSLEQVSTAGKDWIQFDFLVNGNRQDVQNFVQILEIIPYVSRVISVSVEKEISGSWKGAVVIQVQLLSYDQ